MSLELMTPDGRYHVIQGRLWRAPNPALPAEAKVRHMRELLNGRRALKTAKATGDDDAISAARRLIAGAQVGLGERGKVWWQDGAADFNRAQVRNSPYAEWFAQIDPRLQAAASA